MKAFPRRIPLVCRSIQRPAAGLLTGLVFFLAGFPRIHGQAILSAQSIADALVAKQTAAAQETWDLQRGLRAEALEATWHNTANGEYFRFNKRDLDALIGTSTDPVIETGTQRHLENSLLGSSLLRLYRVTLDARYFKAAKSLREEVASACGVKLDSWAASVPALDSPCRAQPFLAEYASVFAVRQDFEPIARSFRTWGSEKQSISDSAWFSAWLVDALPYFPADDPDRAALIEILQLRSATAAQHQDPATGAFYDQTAHGKAMRQELSPTDAALLIYALMKGVRLGYLPVHDANYAELAWRNVEMKAMQSADLDKGALLLAANEMESAPHNTEAHGKTVLMDGWYNSQRRKNAAGGMEFFHYKWEDYSDSGFSAMGHAWQNVGASLDTLNAEPTLDALRTASFYFIVSPDIPAKNPAPHYMVSNDADAIEAWVRQGGVLVLLENDPPNADLEHMNLLAVKFGIHFDNVLHHHTVGDQIDYGRIRVDGRGSLFHQTHIFYMKDTCAISIHGPAKAVLTDRGDIVMAIAHVGKGTVFAAVDPWLYNEYTDGRKDPPAIYSQFDNFAGGKELVQWLLQQAPAAQSKGMQNHENHPDR